jgi:hypothetical protein
VTGGNVQCSRNSPDGQLLERLHGIDALAVRTRKVVLYGRILQDGNLKIAAPDAGRYPAF